MQEISNYGDLKESLKSWLNRKDQATMDKIPIFVNFAEKEFTRLLRLPYYETMVKATIYEGYEYLDIPPDFLAMKHLSVNGKIATRVDVETFQRLQAKKQETKGMAPYFFARVGTMIRTYPELKKGDEVMMIYHRDIPEMKDDADSPYSLIIAPDVLLYLALRHASIFLRDNDEEQYWAGRAADAATAVRAQLDEAEWSGSSLQVVQFDED